MKHLCSIYSFAISSPFLYAMFSIVSPLNYVLHTLVGLSVCLPVCILACVYFKTKVGSYLPHVSSPGKHTSGLGQAWRSRYMRGCSWDWSGGQEVEKELTVLREETSSFLGPQSCRVEEKAWLPERQLSSA